MKSPSDWLNEVTLRCHAGKRKRKNCSVTLAFSVLPSTDLFFSCAVIYPIKKRTVSRFSLTISRCFHGLAVFVQPREATIATKSSVSCISKDVRCGTSSKFARRPLFHFSASRFLAIAIYLYSFYEVTKIRPGVGDSMKPVLQSFDR